MSARLGSGISPSILAAFVLDMVAYDNKETISESI